MDKLLSSLPKDFAKSERIMKALVDFRYQFESKAIFILFAYALIGFFIVLIQEKGALELWINARNNQFFDFFFKYFTLLGDGWLYLILAIAFMAYRYAWFIYLTLTIILQTVFVQIPKRVIFVDQLRPAAYFKGLDLNFVEGVTIHTHFSFPSGHSATAFAIATIIFLMFPRLKWLHIIAAIAAVLAAFSRVYLMQHFIEDTIVGGMIGMMSAWIAFFATHHLFSIINYKQGLLVEYRRL